MRSWVRIPPPRPFNKKPPFGGFLLNGGHGSNTNCLVLRRDSKGAALYEFACELASRKASTASPACRKNPSGILPEGEVRRSDFPKIKNHLLVVFLLNGGHGSNTNCLVLRREEKAGAMFLFERAKRKAKTARPGPKAFYVSKTTAGESRRPIFPS